MSERFGADAARLAGMTGRALGWPPAWFWSATPAELAAILSGERAPGEAMTRDQLETLMEQDRHGR